jgi:endonuclease V-like protein UPF0215 family
VSRRARRRQPRWSHVIGFDDAPFPPDHRGAVLIVGAVYAGARLDGVLSCRVRRDGANSTERLTTCVARSRYYAQIHAVLLQGIALAGFNVVDIHELSAQLARPVIAIMRRRPDLAAIREALLGRVRSGSSKWRLIQRAPAVEPVGKMFVQRVGISEAEACALIEQHARHGVLPEPLRAAHLIAGGVVTGESTGRP